MKMSLLSSSRGKKRDEATKMIKKTKKSFSVFHSLSSLSRARAFKISLSLLVCLVTTFLSLSLLSPSFRPRKREKRASFFARFSREMSVLYATHN